MKQFKDISLEIESRVALLTLGSPTPHDPARFDAITLEIEAACRAVQEDEGISVFILTGSGPSFSLGGEKEHSAGLPPPSAGAEKRRVGEGMRRIALALDGVDVPIIAAVNGAAVGSGCDLALMCDIRIASSEAAFGQPRMDLSRIPGGGPWFFPPPAGVPSAEAQPLISAGEALKSGLVSRVAPPEELMAEARLLAGTIASKPMHTVRLAKLLMKKSVRMELNDFLAACARS